MQFEVRTELQRKELAMDPSDRRNQADEDS